MTHIIKYVVLIIVTSWISGCSNSPTPLAPASQITLIYSGNLDGELEPCGCSEGGNKGGIKRRANMIDKLRAETPELFLISAGGLLISELPQDRLKSEYILKGLAKLNYDAIGVQWQDLAFGQDFIQKSSLPFVSSNWHNSSISSHKLVTHAGRSLAFFQWLDPLSNPQKEMPGAQNPATQNIDRLKKDIQTQKEIGNTTVLSTTLPLATAQNTLPLAHVDILIIKASYEIYGKPQRVNKTLVLQPGSRGMYLGKLNLVLDDKGSIISWQSDIIPLPPAVGDAPRMKPWYKEYNAKIEADYWKRVEVRKAMQSGESPYAGEAVCKTCHAKAHTIWQASAHAEAFYALEDVNKAFDPDCIPCHTVGFEKQGGFIDPMITAKLMNVQCESCHGAAKKHAQTGGQIPVANASWPKKKICNQCHVQKHSPDFNFDTYWPKIMHGK